MALNREAIYSALFTKLQTIAGLNTCSRILKHWTDVGPEAQPALFMAQIREIAGTEQSGRPTEWKLYVSLFVYVRTDGITPPGAVMNPILDAIEAIVQARHPVTGKNNLGGGIPNLEWCRIDGTIETDEGTLGNQAVAIIPLLLFATA